MKVPGLHWINPVKPSEADFEYLERTLHQELPADLKAFFSKTDGAILNGAEFSVDGHELGVDYIYSVGQSDFVPNIQEMYQSFVINGLIENCHIPIADSLEGHEMYLYSFCEGQEGTIWVTESAKTLDASSIFQVFLSFQEFLGAIGLAGVL